MHLKLSNQARFLVGQSNDAVRKEVASACGQQEIAAGALAALRFFDKMQNQLTTHRNLPGGVDRGIPLAVSLVLCGELAGETTPGWPAERAALLYAAAKRLSGDLQAKCEKLAIEVDAMVALVLATSPALSRLRDQARAAQLAAAAQAPAGLAIAIADSPMELPPSEPVVQYEAEALPAIEVEALHLEVSEAFEIPARSVQSDAPRAGQRRAAPLVPQIAATAVWVPAYRLADAKLFISPYKWSHLLARHTPGRNGLPLLNDDKPGFFFEEPEPALLQRVIDSSEPAWEQADNGEWHRVYEATLDKPYGCYQANGKLIATRRIRVITGPYGLVAAFPIAPTLTGRQGHR